MSVSGCFKHHQHRVRYQTKRNQQPHDSHIVYMPEKKNRREIDAWLVCHSSITSNLKFLISLHLHGSLHSKFKKFPSGHTTSTKDRTLDLAGVPGLPDPNKELQKYTGPALLCLLGVFLWITKSSEHPVHPYSVMTIIVAVRSVVDCVVASAHDRPHFAMDAVMNVGRPYSLNKQEKYVSHQLGRDKEEGYHMWHRLQYPIQWMECQSCEKRTNCTCSF